MLTLWKRLLHERHGVTALEYGLIAAVVAIVMVAGASQLGTNQKGYSATCPPTSSDAAANQLRLTV